MNIKDIMTSKPVLTNPSISLKEAAEKMGKEGIGFLLVGEDDKLQGTLTDRDIVIRAVSQGRDTETTSIGDILTSKILYCHEDQTVEEVARNMSDQQVRRLAVVNAEKRLVGVVSLGDIAQHLSADVAGHILQEVTTERHAA